MNAYTLPFREWRRLRLRAEAANSRGNQEVCGVLAVDSNGRLALYDLENETDEPGSAVLSYEPIAAARRNARNDRKRPIGLFHSHPISEAVFGKREDWRFNEINLIYDVCAIHARLWRTTRRRGKRINLELPLEIERSPRAAQVRRRRRSGLLGITTITRK